MNYKIKKTILGIRVYYKCPNCLVSLNNPLREAGYPDMCPDCGHRYKVPGESERVDHETSKAQEVKDRADLQQAKREAQQAKREAQQAMWEAQEAKREAQEAKQEAQRLESLGARMHTENPYSSPPPYPAVSDTIVTKSGATIQNAGCLFAALSVLFTGLGQICQGRISAGLFWLLGGIVVGILFLPLLVIWLPACWYDAAKPFLFVEEK